jgi:sugar/nucleoside kinase (ribokinase family)
MTIGVDAGARAIDVLAVGGTSLDTVITLDRLPSHDEKVIGALAGYVPGGPAANFACAASRLGLRAAALARIGDDDAGRRIIADFERFGVDTSHVQVIEGSPSTFTICLVDPSGEKAVVVVPMLDQSVPRDAVRRLLPSVRLLFGIPSDHAWFGELARLAHDRGVEVMIDVEPSSLPQTLDPERFLADIDIVAFNEASFRAASGETPSISAARRLLRYGPRLIIVTRGAGGALAVTADEAAECPAFPVEVVDSTGASDIFNAAFVRAMFDAKPLAECVRFANAAAALAVTAMGSRGRLPNEEEVQRFLQMYSPSPRPAPPEPPLLEGGVSRRAGRGGTAGE